MTLKTMQNIPWVPIITVMGTLIIGGLIGLICTLENPSTAQYNSIIREIYTAETALTTEEEVLEAFPELAVVKQKMKQVQQMRLRRQDFFSHPAPIYAQGKAEEMVRYQKEINNRGGEISILLDSFSTKIKLVTQNH